MIATRTGMQWLPNSSLWRSKYATADKCLVLCLLPYFVDCQYIPAYLSTGILLLFPVVLWICSSQCPLLPSHSLNRRKKINYPRLYLLFQPLLNRKVASYTEPGTNITFTFLLNFILAIKVFYVGLSQAVPSVTATRHNIIIIMQIMNVSLELDHPHRTLVTKLWYTDSVVEVSAAIRVTDSYLENIIFIWSKAKIFWSLPSTAKWNIITILRL